MGKTLFQKIWDAHTVGILPDGRTQMFIATHLLHEVTSPQAFGMVRDLGLTVRHPERTFATVDHIIPTDNQAEPFADATADAMIRELRRNCAENGIRFFDLPTGLQGIVHMVGPELGITQPGMTIVCGDSHTATHGAFGAIAMGIGTIVSKLLSLTGMTFPVYIGAMIAAACIRNIGEYSGAYVVYMGEINDIGGISLSLFLGMAMITLKLWQLADLAGPLVVLLAGQTVFILLYVVLVVFNVMGRDYDAAVLVSGTCGFGMGATPNAMANMQVVCEKYAPSIKAYLIIPLVGSLFADFLNSLAITLFINLI